jgi:hypothetical protein
MSGLRANGSFSPGVPGHESAGSRHRVAVLNRGRLAQFAAHAELIAQRNRRYADLFADLAIRDAGR